MRRESAPIKGCYRVNDQLLAGEYPSGWNNRQLRTKLRRLLEAGVTSFLDLTEEDEKGLPRYEPLLREVAVEVGRTVQYRRIPIPDFETPTVEQMHDIVDALDAALEAGQMVYLHCFAGIGRTGTVVACYLVRHGRDPQRAIAELARLRQETTLADAPSPATEEQRQLVYDWATLDRSAHREGSDKLSARQEDGSFDNGTPPVGKIGGDTSRAGDTRVDPDQRTEEQQPAWAEKSTRPMKPASGAEQAGTGQQRPAKRSPREEDALREEDPPQSGERPPTKEPPWATKRLRLGLSPREGKRPRTGKRPRLGRQPPDAVPQVDKTPPRDTLKTRLRRLRARVRVPKFVVPIVSITIVVALLAFTLAVSMSRIVLPVRVRQVPTVDLEDKNLQGRDLRGADLQSADLAGADLRGADLRGVNAQQANLSGAILAEADLRYALLNQANLREADLRGANLQSANLTSADLSGARLEGANLRHAHMGDAILPDGSEWTVSGNMRRFTDPTYENFWNP